MRVHSFEYPGHTRYIDLDHVQQISSLYYDANQETVKQDNDGIDYTVKSYGTARFRYQLAFHDEWETIEIEYRKDRYEYELKPGESVMVEAGRQVTNKIDAFAKLEQFKAEYEKFLKAWGGIEPVSG